MDLQKPTIMSQELKFKLCPNFNDSLMHCPQTSESNSETWATLFLLKTALEYCSYRDCFYQMYPFTQFTVGPVDELSVCSNCKLMRLINALLAS